MEAKGHGSAGSKHRFENMAAEDRESSFSMMQHLIDEMDRSSQRIDEYNTQEFGGCMKSSHLDKHQIDLLYDEAWKSEDSDAASLKEVPSDFFDKGQGDGCDDAVTSAIAEVSKDFLAGLRASASRANGGDSDDSGSHLSSDTDFKLIKGMPAYARYPETAAGLSDNDWNPYGTESDTNISPRVLSQETPVARASGSKLASMTSFNPPLHSTNWDVATPSALVVSIPNTGSRTAGRQNTSEKDFVVSLKPDVTADFSNISQVSEQTMDSYVAPPPVSAHVFDLNKTMRKDELEGVATNGQSVGIEILQRELDDLKRSHFQSTDNNIDLPRDAENFKSVSGPYMSVMDRAKMVGVPEDIINGTGKVHGDSFESKGPQQSFSDQGNLSEDDILGRKVKKVLSDTKYLEGGQREKKTMHEVAIDYQTLQRDLQEIQDSLHHNFGSGSASTIVAKNSDRDAHSVVSKVTPPSSDNDGEIIPSTTTTPERKDSARRAWDFHDDLAREINTRAVPSEAQRSPTERQSYNSDGDDTRTSGSSDKVDDHHAAADQALAEMSAILRPHPHLATTAVTGNGIHSAQDVDIMLSNFRDQRRELESRYQQLSNPGLAEKVFRILTSQDPEAQANGILTNASAEERENRTRFALGLYSGNKELNFSTTDTDNPNTSNQSFAAVDDIRKKLDLSALSSADGSRLGEKSSFTMPNSKGFSAFDGMTKFLSSQMAKVSERTFNHSLEMQIPPQAVTCYPLLADHNPNNGTGEDIGGTSNLLASQQHLPTDDLAGNPEDIQPTATSSPVEPINEERQAVGQDRLSSPDDSDSSSGKRKEKYRPYRPPGSKDFYYTESDAASVADSVTTMESTHIGSDDAKGPSLPSAALGSRKDPPNSGGIYAKQKPLGALQEGGTLPTIQEKSICDDRESDPNASSRGSVDRESRRSTERERPSAHNVEAADNRGQKYSGRQGSSSVEEGGIRVQARLTASVDGESNYVNRGVAAARREARWENRMEERDSDFVSKDHGHIVSSEDRAAEFNELSDLGSVGRYTQPEARGSSSGTRSHEMASRTGREEPLSLRVRMTYTDDKEAWRVRQSDHEKEDTVGRKTWQESQRRERDLDDQFRDKWDKFEEERSNQNHGRRPAPLDVAEERQHRHSADSRDFVRSSSPSNIRSSRLSPESGHRGRAFEQAPYTSPSRDARLSPAFHRALSPDLRQAIERRSPLLSHNIKRSLAQAPLNPSARQSRLRDQPEESHPHRTTSPPPTFLARERGQPPRDYARSSSVGGRRSPPPAPGREQAWTEDRVLSPSSQHLRLSSPKSHNPRPRSPVALPQYSEVRSTIPSSFSQDYRPQSPSHTQGYVSPPHQQRSPSPTFGQQRERPESLNQRNSRERHVERTLEHMTSESEDTEVDREPLSRRAKMLKAALPQEQDISPDINVLWDRFKALNESNDSSMNSSRMEAVTDLLRNPSQHLISHYLKEREEYRIERQERVEVERERRLKEQMAQHSSHPVSHLHSSSEEDFNGGGYCNLQAQKEEERMKRRALKKKKGKTVENGKGEKNKENVPDHLFSIPEDGGSDQSPLKSGSATVKQQRNKQQSKQQHVIDPNMQKLREKIARQRGKIDKETLKELQRVEKLKKLEQLLSAKTKNQIGDQSLKEQLAEISSTSTPGSNSSQENNNDGYDDVRENTTPRSEDSTTAKDSSAEMHAWKAEKERRLKDTQLAELDRRREFVSKEKDRNTNRKPSFLSLQHPKMKGGDSELKLLKLVNKGYLSAAEAYRLALERAQLHESVVDDGDSSNASLSSPEEPSFNGRSHRLYSPYARQDTSSQAHSKHVPKLKQLSPTTMVYADPSFQHQNHFRKQVMPFKTGDAFEDAQEKQSSDNFVSGKSKPHMRPSSRSPPPYSRREAAISKLGGSSKYAAGKSSVSPLRGKQLLPHHHHHPQQQRSERFPSRHEPPKYGMSKGWAGLSQAPTPKGVSWQIAFDTHPSKWTEPKGPHEATTADNGLGHQKRGPAGNRNKSSKPAESDGKRIRKQLPLPDGPAQLEEGEEPLQRWEKQGKDSKSSFWNTLDHPQGIPQELWEEVVSKDALASKANHWDVDPLMDRVEYILNKENTAPVTEEPFPHMNLQDAFLARKQIFISKCRERQKRIALAREERHLQECLRLEREAIFAEQDRPVSPNLHAHPVSENLYHPKRRVISKLEMKALTQRRYKTLHEVVKKQEKQRNEAELKLNRLRAKIFNKKVQRDVLRKSSMRRR